MTTHRLSRAMDRLVEIERPLIRFFTESAAAEAAARR
jgi:hypothetical protein